jgi:hypothetical protein
LSSHGPQGLLYVEMDCPAEMEEEFHAWYNTEHIPERLGIKGFLHACRYAALVGAPRWLATYAVESSSVLESPEYMSHYGDFQTPWTKRVTSVVQVYRRTYEAAWGSARSSNAETDGSARGLLAVRYGSSADDLSGVNAWHDSEFAPRLLQLPGVLSARRLRCTDPSSGEECLALYELNDPWATQDPAFVQAWTTGWDVTRSTLSLYNRILYILILDGR